MEVTIEIKHVNALNKPKVTIEDGIVSYTLPFDVQLPPGTFDRIVNLFRQRVPVQLTISSPQAKMDLFTEVFTDTPTSSYTEADIDDLRRQAKDALRTSESAEHVANESGDAGDREVANAAAATAAEAITKAASALDIPENALLTTIGAELHQEILEAGEQQADDIAAGEGAATVEALTPEEREAIPEIEEAEAENPGKEKRTRKSRAGVS